MHELFLAIFLAISPMETPAEPTPYMDSEDQVIIADNRSENYSLFQSA